MIKVLEGVRVVEMGTFITGPAAAMFLADMGADVVKVERPETGDPFRAFKGGLYSPHFQTYNRNKRSVTLDTRETADLALLDDLVREADIFIQNFRPGVAEDLNVGADGRPCAARRSGARGRHLHPELPPRRRRGSERRGPTGCRG